MKDKDFNSLDERNDLLEVWAKLNFYNTKEYTRMSRGWLKDIKERVPVMRTLFYLKPDIQDYIPYSKPNKLEELLRKVSAFVGHLL